MRRYRVGPYNATALDYALGLLFLIAVFVVFYGGPLLALVEALGHWWTN